MIDKSWVGRTAGPSELLEGRGAPGVPAPIPYRGRALPAGFGR